MKIMAHDNNEKESSNSRTRLTIRPELLIIWIKSISCEFIERYSDG